MKWWTGVLALVALVAVLGTGQPWHAQSQLAPGCGLAAPAFCDTFDAPAGIGNRSGDLNGTVWGVSRASGNTNLGAPADGWAQATLDLCGASVSASPEGDVRICGGQLREAVNDGGTVTVLAMYPKQPFDFAGRAGTVVFDVSDDSQGTHAAWPEFWITDKPVPAPFGHEASWQAFAQHALGLRFAACLNGGGLIGVDSAVVVRNYASEDSFIGGNITLQTPDCMVPSSGPDGGLNHIQVNVSQNQVDVWGSDAGTMTMHHLAVLPGINLSFTRGLVWMEDAHYNASKFATQGNHTFAWDNVGFDGPALPRDLTFDVLDVAPPDHLGWAGPVSLTVPGVYNSAGAVAEFVLANVYAYDTGFTLSYSVNGHQHSEAWPFGSNQPGFAWHTYALPLALGDVVDGTNSVSISSTSGIVVANVDILLAGAGGCPSCGTPTPSPTATASPSPTPTPTTTSSPTPVPSPSPSPSPSPTATASPSPTASPSATTSPSPTPSATPTPTASPSPTPTPSPATLGSTSSGSATDDGDRGFINGSSATMPAGHGGLVTSMSVYVSAPVDAAPHNHYQLAIYADAAGAPGALVAHSASGTLNANAWNTVPLSAQLAGGAIYWLVYETDTGNYQDNNLRYGNGAAHAGVYSGAVAFGTWPAQFGAPTYEPNVFSLYATYTPQ